MWPRAPPRRWQKCSPLHGICSDLFGAHSRSAAPKGRLSFLAACSGSPVSRRPFIGGRSTSGRQPAGRVTSGDEPLEEGACSAARRQHSLRQHEWGSRQLVSELSSVLEAFGTRLLLSVPSRTGSTEVGKPLAADLAAAQKKEQRLRSRPLCAFGFDFCVSFSFR